MARCSDAAFAEELRYALCGSAWQCRIRAVDSARVELGGATEQSFSQVFGTDDEQSAVPHVPAEVFSNAVMHGMRMVTELSTVPMAWCWELTVELAVAAVGAAIWDATRTAAWQCVAASIQEKLTPEPVKAFRVTVRWGVGSVRTTTRSVPATDSNGDEADIGTVRTVFGIAQTGPDQETAGGGFQGRACMLHGTYTCALVTRREVQAGSCSPQPRT